MRSELKRTIEVLSQDSHVGRWVSTIELVRAGCGDNAYTLGRILTQAVRDGLLEKRVSCMVPQYRMPRHDRTAL